MMYETAQNLVLEWRSTVAVCQRSGKKWIFHTNTWLLLCLMRHGVGNWAGNYWNCDVVFGIIGLELDRSVSGEVSKRAEMPFMKLNGKSQLIGE